MATDLTMTEAARLTVCGLGPGGIGDLTDATREAIKSADRVFLRTSRHPNAAVVYELTSAEQVETFDHLYDQADTFGEVYKKIADELVAAALSGGCITYVVPGSPLVLEQSVAHLRSDDRVEAQLVPAMSFLDQVWAKLGVDPIESGVRLIDGHQFATQAAGERGPLLVAHVHDRWVASDIKLAVDSFDLENDQKVVVLQRLGTSDELITEVAWEDLDTAVEPDHLTSLWIPEMVEPVGFELARTVGLMHRLRSECPWDQKQTHQSLRKYLLEETHEVLEALDGLEPDDEVCVPPEDGDGPMPVLVEGAEAYELLEEELGDLWLQILFHAELASESGQFGIADVARGLHDKMVRRHPHVFGDTNLDSDDELIQNWDRIKNDEKARASVLDGVPASLPALAYSHKLLSRCERAGWPIDMTTHTATQATGDALSSDPLDEPAVGRRLLQLVVEAHSVGVDSELALRSAIRAAERRFRNAETAGSDPSPNWVFG